MLVIFSKCLFYCFLFKIKCQNISSTVELFMGIKNCQFFYEFRLKIIWWVDGNNVNYFY